MPHVEVWPTPATFYSFWDVTGTFGKRTPDGKTLTSSEEVAAYLVERAGVLTAAGAAFMQEGFLRLSFAVPEEELESGLAASAAAFGELR